MRRAHFLLASVMAGGMCLFATEQSSKAASGAGTPASDARGRSIDQAAQPRGLPANQWRYQFNGGRWWYRTADGGWSYFDGGRWRPYVAVRAYDRRRVDPALLNIEAKEGVLGYRKWPHVRGGGAGAPFPMSGTDGSFGGGFMFPGDLPNTPSGTYAPSNSMGGWNGGVNLWNGSNLGGWNGSGRALQPNTGIGGRQ